MPPSSSLPLRTKRLRAPSLRVPTDDDESSKLLQPLITRLNRATNSASHDASALADTLEPLLQLRPLLASSTGRFKDDFRLLRGFEAVFALIRSISATDLADASSTHALLQLVLTSLSIFSAALYDSVLNRQYFESLRSDDDSSHALLAFIEAPCRAPNSEDQHVVRVLAQLLACAAHDDSISDDFAKFCSVLRNDAAFTAGYAYSVREILSKYADRPRFGKYHLHLAEFCPILLAVWQQTLVPQSTRAVGASDSIVSVALLITLLDIVQAERNTIPLTHTTFTGLLLDLYRPAENPTLLDHLIHRLILTCTRLGLRSLDEADKLFQFARNDVQDSSLLLDCARHAREPPHILFDMTISGFSSLEFPELPHAFPPQDPSTGYSFLAWIKVLSYDDSSHTTIFGAFDESQSCFILMYIERGTQHLVLQTSVTSAKPSVRFKSVKFEPGKWYHIALTQKRPKIDGPSHVALFVDGDFVEQAKCPYPRIPAAARLRTPSGSFASHFEVVQAFYGTPRDLSPRLGPDQLSSAWILASSHLFAEAIPDDLIYVYKSLGPGYHGNFQDALGSFQTFMASALLNLRNEHLHQGQEDESLISRAVRGSASQFNPERNIILSVSPSTMLHKRPGSESLAPWSMVAGALNAKAFDALRHKTRNGANSLVLNGRTPLVEDALLKSTGTGILIGPSLVSSSLSLSNAAWLYSGCVALGLDLIKAARTPRALIEALETFFKFVNDSWRNSEVTERENGFSLLALSLTRKFRQLDARPASERPSSGPTPSLERLEPPKLQLLRAILTFVGHNFERPEGSRIVNPLAYRAFLVECSLWRDSDVLTQGLYYEQFCVFLEQSRYRAFNIRRLGRIRIVKKFIETLKENGVDNRTKVPMLAAFESLLRSAPSADVYRSTALFITASLQEGKLKSPMPSSRLRPASSRSIYPPPPAVDHATEDTALRGPELAAALIEMLSESLAKESRGLHIKKFANAVTNKWLLHLLAEEHDTITRDAMKILARIFGVLGPEYVSRFEDKTKGFLILQDRLKSKWHLQDVWSSCFTILFGMEKELSAFNLVGMLRSLNEVNAAITHPAIVPTMLSMLGQGLNSTNTSPHTTQADIISSVLRIFNALYKECAPFRDFASESAFAKDALKAVFDPNHGQAAGIDPFASEDMGSESRIDQRKPSLVEQALTSPPRDRKLSFVIVDAKYQQDTKLPSLTLPLAPTDRSIRPITSGQSGEQLLIDALCSIFTDQILRRKDFTGLGLYLKAPPGPLQYRSHLTSSITRDISKRLERELQSNELLFQEPRVLNNIARFVAQTCEAIFEGWLTSVEIGLLSFSMSLLHHLETSEMQAVKSVRLCSPQLASIRNLSHQVAIFALLINQDASANGSLEEVLATLLAMQDLLLPRESDEEANFRALLSLMYKQLRSNSQAIQSHTASLWRSFVSQKPDIVAACLTSGADGDAMQAGIQFCLALQENEDIERVVQEHEPVLDALFSSGPAAALAEFIEERNRISETTSAARNQKRKARLEQWHLEEVFMQHLLTEQSLATRNWNSNIFDAEIAKHHRARQDQVENNEYLDGLCHQQEAVFNRVRHIDFPEELPQWQLDDGEGRDRMRMRLTRTEEKVDVSHQPRRRNKNPPKHVTSPSLESTLGSRDGQTKSTSRAQSDIEPDAVNGDDDFEVVAEPQRADDVDQDKNRRVMRSLQSGEEVEDARNVAVIRGLEAQETLMIMGKKALYLIENLFFKADGEVVNVWDAPEDQRDPYIKMISGQKVDDAAQSRRVDVKPKRWLWSDIVSISERQFLLRDVGLEIFFKDGRSYLATATDKTHRDQISARLNAKALAAREPTTSSVQESAWRTAILRASKDAPTSFGSKVAGMFNTSSAKTARRQWQKGEMSNFQYLMLVNSLAGRTFNDLTQYPVFPWIIADYTSEELDLSNPKTFRDLSKPMGCQTPERESAFRDRYRSFAEMDPETPAFHYGTHYSSAMIVSSYMIRLQPFVKSYLLMQGGAFDLAERLFDSIEKAWKSASREGFSDVRELTPEFFYLPDFLVNLNKYDFGTKQSTGETIDDVILPKWAKGDPAVFVAKNREALESPYVSQNLQSWIDLIFGFKQRGEAAVESTNVFHHLSYQGAKDLDTIHDERERVATIGIIHNFGQTPQQVFTRPHDRREVSKGQNIWDLETYQSLTRPVEPITISSEQVWHIDTRSIARDRRRAVYPPWRVPLPSDASLELIWGLTDQSLRLWSSPLGKFLHVREQPHSDQLSAVVWGEDRTAFSSSEDGTIHAWSLVPSRPGSWELQQRGSTLLGHRAAVEHLAVSNAFGTLLSADRAGRLLTWSVSTLELVRCVARLPAIACVAIHDLDATIAVCTDDAVHFYSLNGRPLLQRAICTWETGPVTASAWARQESASDVANRVLATGHARGVVQLWNLHISGRGEWVLDLVRVLEHESAAAVTCVMAGLREVYVGLEDGKVFEWMGTR